MSPSIETASGRAFNFLRPDPESIHIDDIAHALSHLCRFTGHVREFYSVAQHSWIVSYIAPREFALYGLLHDASEAYLGDVSSPLKRLLPDYRGIEKVVQAAIYCRFGLDHVEPQEVREADRIALVTEKRDLLSPDWRLWGDFSDVLPMGRTLAPVSSRAARSMFLDRYNELLERA